MLITNFIEKLIVFSVIFLISASSINARRLKTIPSIPVKDLRADLIRLKKIYEEPHRGLIVTTARYKMRLRLKDEYKRYGISFSKNDNINLIHRKTKTCKNLQLMLLILKLMQIFDTYIHHHHAIHHHYRAN